MAVSIKDNNNDLIHQMLYYKNLTEKLQKQIEELQKQIEELENKNNMKNKIVITPPEGYEMDLNKSCLMSIPPVIYYKETKKELKFPLIAKSKFNDDTILFTSETCGLLVSSKNEKIGKYSEWKSCYDSNRWDIIAEDVKLKKK